MDEASLVDALLRYCYYQEVGIDARHVAPFREEWMGNALSMVPNQPPPNVSDVSSSAGKPGTTIRQETHILLAGSSWAM